MELFAPGSKIARFGLFEADLQQRVLTKSGLRVKLQEQPFQVLILLLERPGEVVSREEIRQKLWSSDTYVEFDDGLNTAIKKLRVALSDAADNPHFIETVPRRGYRFLAPVVFPAHQAERIEPDSSSQVVAQPVLIAGRERSRVVIESSTSRSPWLFGWIAVIVVVAATAGAYFWQRISHPGQPSSDSSGFRPVLRPRPSVAVLGFRNLTGLPESAWLSTAMTEMLSTELAAGRKLRMVAGENIARTKRELPLVQTDTLATDTLLHLHTNLDADYVVLGSYTALGAPGQGRIRLDLRLQDARNGEIVAEEAVSGRDSDLFDLISQVGAHLREKLNAGDLSNDEVTAVRASLPENPAAARLFADGLTKLRSYDNLAANDLLQQAVKLDPGHAMAHAALAQSWRALGYDARAQEEAGKAWKLSENLAREDQLWIEAFYRETTSEWGKAIELYRTLTQFFPDNLEYGLRLAETQGNAGRGKEGLVTIQSLQGLPKSISGDPRIDLQQSFLANQLGDYKGVQAAADRAASKAESRGERLLLARAKIFESTAARNLDDFQKAFTLNEDAQHIFEQSGDTYSAARARIRIADLYFQQGKFAESNRISEECLKVFRALGSKRDVANALDDIGGGLIELGELDQAKNYYEQAIAAQREIGNKRGIATELNNLGVIFEDQGNLALALKTDEQTRDAYAEIGEKDGLSSALNNIGQILLMRGDLAGAKDDYGKSFSLRKELGNESDIAESMHNLAEVIGDQGDITGAMKSYDDALAIRIRLGLDGAAAQTRLGKGQLLLDTGNPRDAEPLIRAAIEQFKKEQQLADEISAHATLAKALLDLGRAPEATSEIVIAKGLDKNGSRDARLVTEIVAAEVRAASDPAGAMRDLQAVIEQTEKSGHLTYQMEASLALGEIEMKASKRNSGLARLEALENTAKTKGFVLIARQASAGKAIKDQAR